MKTKWQNENEWIYTTKMTNNISNDNEKTVYNEWKKNYQKKISGFFGASFD